MRKACKITISDLVPRVFRRFGQRGSPESKTVISSVFPEESGAGEYEVKGHALSRSSPTGFKWLLEKKTVWEKKWCDAIQVWVDIMNVKRKNRQGCVTLVLQWLIR